MALTIDLMDLVFLLIVVPDEWRDHPDEQHTEHDL